MWQLFKGDLPLGNITRGDGPILEGGHESILPAELCELVGQIRERRNRQYSRRRKGTAHFYLLSGVLHCGACQKKLKGYFQDGRRLYRHYGSKQDCPEKWLVADEIESKALKQIGTLADSELLAEIKAEADRLAREVFSTNDSNRAILAELDRQRKRLTRLEDLYLDGEISKQRYRTRKADIDQAIAEIEQKLYNATQTVNFGQVIDRMTTTLNKIPLATPETKKALINSIYERLDVCNGEITHTIPRPWAQPFF